MKDKRQEAIKVKCKRNESLTKQSIFVEYILIWKKNFSFAGARQQMNTESTRRNVGLNKFAFGTP